MLNTTGKLIAAFVTLLIGAVLITSVASEGIAKTKVKEIGDEAEAMTVALNASGQTEHNINDSTIHIVSNPPTGWKVQDCPLTSFVLKNSSKTALTLNTDYTVDLNYGNFTLKNTSATVGNLGADNNTYIDYKYCGDDYMNITWGRTGIDLVPGFFAIAILLTSVGLFYSVAKDYGII